jgi:BirA family biotin operon repressor/biotin-[acetyl-CoA-carboxylase] ligase
MLAQRLGVSRATISHILRDTATLGITLYKIPGRGYQLPASPDWLDASRVRQHLHNTAHDITLDIVDSIDSTNAALLREHASIAHRHCLAAEFQSAGRGRRGRNWLAAPGGGITCSLGWRFEQGINALTGLSLAIGVAVLRALQQCGYTGLQLKWPNDLLWQQRKLCGILVEVQGESDGTTLAIIGIGINVHLPAMARKHIAQAVTDLQEISGNAGNAPDRNVLLATLLNTLVETFSLFEQHGLAALQHEWNAADAYAGQEIQVTLSNGNILTGMANGINEQGALLLRTVQGNLLSLHSGEITHARPLTS